MHVVVDARLARRAGHRTYLGNVVPKLAALAPDWRFTLLAGGSSGVDELTRAANVQTVRCDAPFYGWREQVEVPRLSRGADVLWIPYYNVPLLARGPMVVTVPDCAHLRLPEYARNPLRQLYARTMYGAVRRRAASVMFMSEFSRREFVELVGEPRGSRVTHLGVNDRWFQRDTSEPPEADPYFLCVGLLKPHKNHARLLEAFASIRDSIPHSLVMVGDAERLRTSTQLRLGPRVKRMTHLTDAELQRYMQHATALVFPSLYEGFGLPPLEAMAIGTPVIASRAAAIPEVCGDAALYVDPLSVQDIADAMRRVAGDRALRDELTRKGAARAKLFSWDATAAATHEVFRSLH